MKLLLSYVARFPSGLSTPVQGVDPAALTVFFLEVGGTSIVFHTQFYKPVLSIVFVGGICGMTLTHVLLLLDPFSVYEIAILY